MITSPSDPSNGQQGAAFVQAWRWFFVWIGMPGLAILGLTNAANFDPYTDSFFTKTYIAPYPDMPFELHAAGWVFVGIGLVIATFALRARWLFRVTTVGALKAIWFALWVGAFGGAFHLAAVQAQKAMDERRANETRSA